MDLISRWCDGSGRDADKLYRDAKHLKTVCPECGRDVRTVPNAQGGRRMVRHLREGALLDLGKESRDAEDTLSARLDLYDSKTIGALPYSPDLEQFLPVAFWKPTRKLFIRYLRAVFMDPQAKVVEYKDMGLVQLMARGQIGVGTDARDAWDRLIVNCLDAASHAEAPAELRWWAALLPLSQGAKGVLDRNKGAE